MPTAPADGVTGLLAERAVVPHMMVVDGRSIGQRHVCPTPGVDVNGLAFAFKRDFARIPTLRGFDRQSGRDRCSG
jgi:hypothetical protein